MDKPNKPNFRGTTYLETYAKLEAWRQERNAVQAWLARDKARDKAFDRRELGERAAGKALGMVRI